MSLCCSLIFAFCIYNVCELSFVRTFSTHTASISEELACQRNVKQTGIITDITTSAFKFIAFTIPTATDSTLDLYDRTGEKYTFLFSATNHTVHIHTSTEYELEYMAQQFLYDDASLATFWISWITDSIHVGIGDLIHNDMDIIISVRAVNTSHELNVTSVRYDGSNWIFYDLPTSSVWCRPQLLPNNNTSIPNAPSLHEYVAVDDTTPTAYITSAIWEHDNYVIFDVHSADTAYIALQMNQSTNTIAKTLKFLFQASECTNTNSFNLTQTKPIEIVQETENYNFSVYCTDSSNYDLSLNWTFYLWWNDNVLLFGNGAKIGNRIIYTFDNSNDFAANLVSDIYVGSIQPSEWTFYYTNPPTSAPTTDPSVPPTYLETTSQPTEARNVGFIQRDDTLICKRYYTHSNSKSVISRLVTMQYNFIAFSVQMLTEDASPKLILSHFDTNSDDNQNSKINTRWWWNIELDITKQLIVMTNNSESRVAQQVYPTRFRIADDDDCYLDITHGAVTDNGRIYEHGLYGQELNLFWNCETLGPVWTYDDEANVIYHKELELFWSFGQRGYGFQIEENELNAKVTPLFDESVSIGFRPSTDKQYKIAFEDPFTGDLCELGRAEQQHVYQALDGQTFLFGHEAKFRCIRGDGADVKLIIASLASVGVGDWVSFWITSFGNNNIRVGIGELIGNDDDVLFAFDYEQTSFELLTHRLEYACIDSSHSTRWIFYDYPTASSCDLHVMQEYQISQQILHDEVEYHLMSMQEVFIPRYLWNNHYLMFNATSSGEIWVEFIMTTDDVFTIEYARDHVRDVCGVKSGGTLDYILMLKNTEYIYCSEYAGYDVSTPYLFWIWWDHQRLQIGNGAEIGQSVIAEFDSFHEHAELESVLIGCEAQTSSWQFYTRQKSLSLREETFTPQSVLSFSFDFDPVGIFERFANISIISDALDIRYLLLIDFEDDSGCNLCNEKVSSFCTPCTYTTDGIKIVLPGFKHIRMHETFDAAYYVDVNSSDLLLAHNRFVLKRTHFMNLTVEFNSHLTFGETLQITSYHIENTEITQNSTRVHVLCPTLGIDAELLINYAVGSCQLCTVENSRTKCVSCLQGLPVHEDEEHVSNSSISTHSIYLQSNDTILAFTETSVTMNPCGIGSGLMIGGVIGEVSSCIACPMDYVNLFETDDECHACSTDKQQVGYSCQGAADILVKQNYWISIARYSPEWQSVFTDLDDTGDNYTPQIISSLCPPLYCCPSQDGCLYHTNTKRRRLTDFDEDAYDELCAQNRDPSVPLCGACLPGYSEVYGSTACKICEGNYYFYLLIGLLIGLFYAIGISFVIEHNGDTTPLDQPQAKEPKPADAANKDNRDSMIANISQQIETFNFRKLLVYDSVQALLISLFRPITYFYQSMSYILVNYTGYSIYYMMPLLQIFSMDLSVHTHIEDGGFCFVSGLTAFGEELWLFYLPFCLFVSIAAVWIFMLFGGSYLLQKCGISYSPNLVGMLWSAMLLCMHTVIIRLFRIVACKQIGNVYIHYFFGINECFDSTWFIAAGGIFCILLFWIIIWLKLYCMDPIQRQQSSRIHHQSIISPYRHTRWYWEFVLLARRIIISALVTFKFIEENYFNLALGITLIFFLILHLSFRPFKYKRINHMESFCLFSSLCCFTVINFAFNELFMSVFVTILLLLPLALYLTRIYCIVKLYCSLKQHPHQLDRVQQHKLFKAINRLPRNQQTMILAIIQKKMPHIKFPRSMEELDEEKHFFSGLKAWTKKKRKLTKTPSDDMDNSKTDDVYTPTTAKTSHDVTGTDVQDLIMADTADDDVDIDDDDDVEEEYAVTSHYEDNTVTDYHHDHANSPGHVLFNENMNPSPPQMTAPLGMAPTHEDKVMAFGHVDTTSRPLTSSMDKSKSFGFTSDRMLMPTESGLSQVHLHGVDGMYAMDGNYNYHGMHMNDDDNGIVMGHTDMMIYTGASHGVVTGMNMANDAYGEVSEIYTPQMHECHDNGTPGPAYGRMAHSPSEAGHDPHDHEKGVLGQVSPSPMKHFESTERDEEERDKTVTCTIQEEQNEDDDHVHLDLPGNIHMQQDEDQEAKSDQELMDFHKKVHKVDYFSSMDEETYNVIEMEIEGPIDGLQEKDAKVEADQNEVDELTASVAPTNDTENSDKKEVIIHDSNDIH